MAGEPILIVDDNPVNLKLARVLLTGEGYQVRTAADAEEALEDDDPSRRLRETIPRLLPICAYGKSIRSDDESWQPIERCVAARPGLPRAAGHPADREETPRARDQGARDAVTSGFA